MGRERGREGRRGEGEGLKGERRVKGGEMEGRDGRGWEGGER